MDTDSLVYHIKTDDFYTDITDDVPARFKTSRYCPNRPLPVRVNKKVIGLMKDELGGKIMTEFIAVRPKLYSYKKLDGSEDKKCKGIKKCIVKRTLTFEDYKTCLFRDTCLKHYKLDPAHFYTSPGLACKACLKCTGIKLELLTDPDMLLMFERGIRGGITQVVRKYASANNKYMGDRFDPKYESSYLQYLDANNLYGWTMSQPLPTG